MQQRRPRLGDILDDYCPRERRVTNHAVVAIVDDDVRQTRCATCDAEHEYRQGKAPAPRRAKSQAALDARGHRRGPARARGAPPAGRAGARGGRCAGAGRRGRRARSASRRSATGGRASPTPHCRSTAHPYPPEQDVADPNDPREDDGPVHRRLIRATFPRPEGHVPERREPEFTVRQPAGRGRGEVDGNRVGYRSNSGRNQRHGQPGGFGNFGARPQGGGWGSDGQRGGRGPGGHADNRQGGGGQHRGPRPGRRRTQGRPLGPAAFHPGPSRDGFRRQVRPRGRRGQQAVDCLGDRASSGVARCAAGADLSEPLRRARRRAGPGAGAAAAGPAVRCRIGRRDQGRLRACGCRVRRARFPGPRRRLRAASGAGKPIQRNLARRLPHHARHLRVFAGGIDPRGVAADGEARRRQRGHAQLPGQRSRVPQLQRDGRGQGGPGIDGALPGRGRGREERARERGVGWAHQDARRRRHQGLLEHPARVSGARAAAPQRGRERSGRSRRVSIERCSARRDRRSADGGRRLSRRRL